MWGQVNSASTISPGLEMDIATLTGLAVALGLIGYTMMGAGGFGAFIEVGSLAVVFGGSIGVLLMRSTLPDFINAWARVLKKTILNKNEDR